MDIEAEKVTKLGSSIDLGLPGVLALAQHCRGHQLVAVLAADQIGRLEKDRRSVSEGQAFPCWLCVQGGIDSQVDHLGGRHGIAGYLLLVIGRVHLVLGVRFAKLRLWTMVSGWF